MGKVSIAFRGWRFDEDAVFDEDGNFRPLEEIPEDERRRLVRLDVLQDLPCDACYVVQGEENLQQCNVPTAVYGEVFGEVLLCDEHESDFYYWWTHEGGDAYEGSKELEDAFLDWFADGGRAPDWYDGPEHVETDPDTAPRPDVPDPSALDFELPEDEQVEIDLHEGEVREGGSDVESVDDLDLGDDPTRNL